MVPPVSFDGKPSRPVASDRAASFGATSRGEPNILLKSLLDPSSVCRFSGNSVQDRVLRQRRIVVSAPG